MSWPSPAAAASRRATRLKRDVDDDGHLRRLDLRVGARSTDTTDTTTDGSGFFVDTSVEYWDLGADLGIEEPDPTTVTTAAALADAAVPAQLSPCYFSMDG